MEPQVVAWEQAMAWALDGTIRDAKTLVALLLWDRLRSSEEWRSEGSEERRPARPLCLYPHCLTPHWLTKTGEDAP